MNGSIPGDKTKDLSIGPSPNPPPITSPGDLPAQRASGESPEPSPGRSPGAPGSSPNLSPDTPPNAPANSAPDLSRVPPEFSHFFDLLSRAINTVVLKAFQQGLSDGRSTSKPASGVRVSSTGKRGDRAAKAKAPANEHLEGDGEDIDMEDVGDEEKRVPHTKNKKPRDIGKRSGTLKEYHVCVSVCYLWFSRGAVLTVFVRQGAVRKFLRDYNLLPEKGKPLPLSVSEEALSLFEQEGRSAGPTLNDPDNPLLLNWTASLSKEDWNVAAINVLALRLHRKLSKAKPGKYGPAKLDVETCRDQIRQRLGPVKTAICKSVVTRAENAAWTLTRMRRASRRRSVSPLV